MPVWLWIIAGEFALGCFVAMFFRDKQQQKVIQIVVATIIVSFIILMIVSTRYGFVFQRL